MSVLGPVSQLRPWVDPTMTEVVRPGWIDRSKVVFTRSTAATYWADGVLKIAPPGEPVFEDGAWRLEPTATNRFTTELFTAGPWTGGIRATGIDAPDGSNDAIRVSGRTGATTSPTATRTPMTNGVKTIKMFARKAGTNPNFCIDARDETTPRNISINARIDLDTLATVNIPAGMYVSAVRRPRGWVEISITLISSAMTTPVPNGAMVGWYFGYKVGAPTADDPNNWFDVWSAHAIDSAVDQSLILPGATAVTRVGDGASITGANFSDVWGDTEGAFLIDMEVSGGTGNSAACMIYGTSSAGDRIHPLFYNASGGIAAAINVMSGGVGTRLLDTSVDWRTQRVKAGFTYAQSGADGFINNKHIGQWTPEQFVDPADMLQWRIPFASNSGVIRVHRVRFSKQRPAYMMM